MVAGALNVGAEQVIEHSAYGGPEGSLVIDIFQPVREDYRDRWNALP